MSDKTNEPIPEALVLVVYKEFRGVLDGPSDTNRYMKGAQPLRPGEELVVYKKRGHYWLIPPSTGRGGEDWTTGFVVFAPGYRPKYFYSRERTLEGNERFVWSLQPLPPEEARGVLFDLRRIVDEDEAVPATVSKWEHQEIDHTPYPGQLLEPDQSIPVRLTEMERNVVDDFVDRALSQLPS